jgi:hypothetical protein
LKWIWVVWKRYSITRRIIWCEELIILVGREHRYRLFVVWSAEQLPIRTSIVDLEACVCLRLIEVVDIEIGLEEIVRCKRTLTGWWNS